MRKRVGIARAIALRPEVHPVRRADHRPRSGHQRGHRPADGAHAREARRHRHRDHARHAQRVHASARASRCCTRARVRWVGHRRRDPDAPTIPSSASSSRGGRPIDDGGVRRRRRRASVDGERVTRARRPAGGVVVRSRVPTGDGRALFLLIRDSYQQLGLPEGPPRDRRARRRTRRCARCARRPGSTISRCAAASTRSTGTSASAAADPQGLSLLPHGDAAEADDLAAARGGHHRVPVGAVRRRARRSISYANARDVLRRANEMIAGPDR